MEFLKYFNQSKFLGFVPKIKKNPEHWRLVEVVLTGKTRHNAAYIAKQLMEYFGPREGAIFICNAKEILVIAHMEDNADMNNVTVGISDKMPKYSCTATSTEITGEGLKKFQLRLQDLEGAENPANSRSALLTERQQREEKIVMVVDDDMFMRSLIVKAFKNKATVIEAGDVTSIIDTYLEKLPDILFLDIHMPGGSGIDVLSELLNFDETAYVIIMSSDSVKDNVMEAKKLGAKGFISKPFTPEKLESCYSKCPSVILKTAAGSGNK